MAKNTYELWKKSRRKHPKMRNGSNMRLCAGRSHRHGRSARLKTYDADDDDSIFAHDIRIVIWHLSSTRSAEYQLAARS